MAVERSLFDGQGICGGIRTDVDRGAMVEARAVVSATERLASRRTATDRRSALLRGDSVDVAIRGRLEGVAERVSVGEHLLAATARLGRRGRAGGSVARAARRVGRTRSLGLGGMLRGCDVHPG